MCSPSNSKELNNLLSFESSARHFASPHPFTFFISPLPFNAATNDKLKRSEGERRLDPAT